ncbi:MAG TPA: pyridoxamine 5'-phosphate oxidase family protein [Candidatus Limnocylindrales bacterium]|nr:pyridoxamine 5'-phosphate oxidase family protein [Candidatus Limnocylindrales bacterium]
MSARVTAADVYRRHPEQSEIDEVLAGRGVAALGTLNDDGSIHLTYLLFLYEDGRFLLETASSTRKARNVAARGTASLLVQGQASSGRSLMVSCEGSARIISLPEAQEANHRLRAKYLVEDAVAAIDAAWGAFDDVSIEVVPERWHSWTGDEFARTTQESIGRDYEEIWKPD